MFALIFLTAIGAASQYLWLGRAPWLPAERFTDAGMHGQLLVWKGLAVLGAGLLAGAALGRVLPAMIVTLVAFVAIHIGGQYALNGWLEQEALRHVVTPTGEVGDLRTVFPGGTCFSIRWRAADGQILDDAAAAALNPNGVLGYDWMSANFVQVITGVPGTAYPDWERGQAFAIGMIALSGLAGTIVVVARRRPT